MKTAGTAGQAGAELVAGVMKVRQVISLCDESLLEECLQILFQRQRWFLNGWKLLYSHQRYTLPQLEICLEFERERILVVFFEPGKVLGLALTAKEFSRVVVIMDGAMSVEDEGDLSMLGRVLNRQGKKLGITDGLLLTPKFCIFGAEPEKMLEKFCHDLQKGLDFPSSWHADFEGQVWMEWRD